MEKLIKPKQELLYSQNSTETKTNLNSSDIKINRTDIHQIDNTIFNIVNDPEKGWFLTIGHNIITEPQYSREEALKLLSTDKWNIIMKMIILVVDQCVETILKENNIIK